MIALCVFAGFVFTSCNKNSSESAKNNQNNPVPVSVDRAGKANVPLIVNAVGVVEAYAVVSVKSQVAGVLQKIHFREGKFVKKGDPLFSIDPRPFEAMVKQAEAVLARDMASLENAKKDEERFGALAKEGFVSKEKLGQSQTSSSTLEAIVRADMAALDNARLQRSYCDIKAPISGVTGSLTFDEGNLVKVSDDKPMVTIRTIKPIRVSFTAPERLLGEIRNAMSQRKLPVRASLSDRAEAVETGFVEYIENTVDASTGAITLKALFDNGERILWPGQFVKVSLELGMIEGAVVVPAQAVQTGQSGQYVAVVEKDMTARIQPVRTGVTFNGQ
ncbi:MAG: efflux RND transporter periplasmic adaptor subunit, partial [Nitrospinae bacterium]|nr:efflux RND transporter periplasmic adaptor subunit [Nitrospinota bacterium]